MRRSALTMPTPPSFSLFLVPKRPAFTWGSMVHDCCLATNALTGDTFEEHLRSRTNRIVYAQMIRECLAAFSVAAQRGTWVPDNGGSCAIPLSVLELLLCLPTPLFAPLSWIIFRSAPGAGSPAQADLHARRKTHAAWALEELLGVGKKYDVKMAAVGRVHELLLAAVQEKNGAPCIPPADILRGIDANFDSTTQLLRVIFLSMAAVLGVFLVGIVINVALPRDVPTF